MVGALENGQRSEGIAHGRHIARHRAVTHRDQQRRVLADGANFVLVLHAADRTFDQHDVHLFGIDFEIDQWTINQLELTRESQKPLVHIEKGHVAARAAIQPDRCQF